MKVKCSLLDNIVYDFENNRSPIDNLNKDVFGFCDGLTWKETAKLIKYYNLALKHGLNSVYHLKLVFTAVEIIKKYHKTADFNYKIGYGAYNKHYYKKYYKNLQY